MFMCICERRNDWFHFRKCYTCATPKNSNQQLVPNKYWVCTFFFSLWILCEFLRWTIWRNGGDVFLWAVFYACVQEKKVHSTCLYGSSNKMCHFEYRKLLNKHQMFTWGLYAHYNVYSGHRAFCALGEKESICLCRCSGRVNEKGT